LLALALVAAVTTAHGQTTTLATSGGWIADYGGTDGLCSLSSMWAFRDNLGDAGALFIKQYPKAPYLVVQIFKDSWRFPRDETAVPLSLSFDNSTLWTGEAKGYTGSYSNGKPKHKIEFYLEDGKEVEFMDRFRSARTIALRFGGSERPWSTDITGTREVFDAFIRCIREARSPTQPFGGATRL
jgi:hypothetical protein